PPTKVRTRLSAPFMNLLRSLYHCRLQPDAAPKHACRGALHQGDGAKSLEQDPGIPIFCGSLCEAWKPRVSGAQTTLELSPRRRAGAMAGRQIARALRDNALLAFPPEAFEEDVIVRSFLGRQQIILNRPPAIHHILIENPDNYRRTST